MIIAGNFRTKTFPSKMNRGGFTMEKDVTLSCPDGYELTCMRDRKSDKCCYCCVSIVSPIRKSST